MNDGNAGNRSADTPLNLLHEGFVYSANSGAPGHLDPRPDDVKGMPRSLLAQEHVEVQLETRRQPDGEGSRAKRLGMRPGPVFAIMRGRFGSNRGCSRRHTGR